MKLAFLTEMPKNQDIVIVSVMEKTMNKKQSLNILLGISALIAAGLSFCGCNEPENNDPCKVYPSCLTDSACQASPEVLQACKCMDAELAATAECNGGGVTPQVDCNDKANCSKAECANADVCKTGPGPGPGPGPECDSSDDNGDADNDGISNIVEKSVLGTDPCKPDTDGDGLLDGEEDANHDGVIDKSIGETDPKDKNSPDLTQVGVRREICTYDKMLNGEDIDFGNTRVAKFKGAKYSTASNGKAVYFDDEANGVYGFVSASSKADSAKLIMSNAAKVAGVEKLVEESNFTSDVPLASWSEKGEYKAEYQVVPDHTVQRLRYSFTIQSGMSIKAIRNQFLGNYIEDSALSSQNGDDVCNNTTAKAVLVRSLHSDGTDNIFSFAITCESNAAVPQTKAAIEDVISGTMVAPAKYKAFKQFVCEIMNIGDATGMVDFLWVVDNSGSMEDEQNNLSATISEFMKQLKNSGIDWRVGVTTTDAYLLDEVPDYYTKDEERKKYISNDTGLRYKELPGKMLDYMYSSTDGGASANIQAAVTQSNYGQQANINGFGLEDGFESGLAALRRLKNYQCKESDTEALCQKKKLRDGAINYVIWLSDEENRHFKEKQETYTKNEFEGKKVCRTALAFSGDVGSYSKPKDYIDDATTPCGPSLIEAQNKLVALADSQNYSLDQVKEVDATYGKVLEYYITEYQKYNTVAFALVGDIGKENGGFCIPLEDRDDAKDGANYGLSYILAARLISGTNENTDKKEGGFGSVCNDAYSTTVSSILEDAVGRVSNYTLKGYPISSTIRVAVTTKNGTIELERSSELGWQYDASQNSIVLYGMNELGIESGNPMAIAYVIWQENKG